MRAPIAVALILATLQFAPQGSASTAPAQLEFGLPSQFNGDASSAGAQWAILVFDQPSSSFEAGFDGSRDIENRSRLYPVRATGQNFDTSPYRSEETTYGQVVGNSLIIAPRARSSLVVYGEDIRFSVEGANGTLNQLPAHRNAADFMRPSDHKGHLFIPPGSGKDLVVQTYTGQFPFSLDVSRPLKVEWFNADIACSSKSEWCPSGGGLSAMKLPNLANYSLSSERYSYEGLLAPDNLSGSGVVEYAVIGGALVDLSLQGSIRLPIATGQFCSDCLEPDGKTLALDGELHFVGLRTSGDGRIAGSLSGNVVSARLDEKTVDPKLIMGLGFTSAAAVLAGGVLAVKALVGALFTRFHGRDSLENPRRRLIYETVVANPGIGFNELSKTSGIASGSVRHHMNILLRQSKLVERKKGFALHYFENHGKYDETWPVVAALRDDKLRELHTWATPRGEITQKEVLDAWEARGWSRSSTQHRLDRLQAKGLVAVRWQGRRKFYSVLAGD